VSNAGGLGTFAAHNAGSPANLRAWVATVRALAPGKPFGVNFTILPSMGEPPPYDEYAQVSCSLRGKVTRVTVWWVGYGMVVRWLG